MARKRKDDGRNHKTSHKPLQRNAANARERARMRVLSRAFSRLKTTLPWVPADTKLSKLDTLRLATSYIGHLGGILGLDEPNATNSHPLALSWPFTFYKEDESRIESTNPNQLSTFDPKTTANEYYNDPPECITYDRYYTDYDNYTAHIS